MGSSSNAVAAVILEMQPQSLPVPADSSILIDLNLLRVTPNPHHHDHGAARHLLRWRLQPTALAPVPLLLSPLSPCCHSSQAS